MGRSLTLKLNAAGDANAQSGGASLTTMAGDVKVGLTTASMYVRAGAGARMRPWALAREEGALGACDRAPERERRSRACARACLLLRAAGRERGAGSRARVRGRFVRGRAGTARARG